MAKKQKTPKRVLIIKVVSILPCVRNIQYMSQHDTFTAHRENDEGDEIVEVTVYGNKSGHMTIPMVDDNGYLSYKSFEIKWV